MPSLLELPDELLLRVISHLYLPELARLSFSCHRVSNLCRPRLIEHELLRSRFRHLSDSARWPEKHPFRADESLPRWSRALLELIPSPTAQHYVSDLFIYDVTDYERTSHTPSAAAQALLQTAAAASNWPQLVAGRENEQGANFTEALLAGDDDAALVVLLPLLRNLRHIRLPCGCWGGLNLMFTGVAVAAAAKQHALHPSLSLSLPLFNLREISAGVVNEYYGVGLECLAIFMALPNVHSITAEQVHDDDKFMWPADLPQSRVEKVVFRQSTVSLGAAREFAKGIIGPCRIEHENAGWRRHEDLGLPREAYEWDVLEVTAQRMEVA